MAEYIEREVAYPLAKKICDAIDKVPRCILGHDILDFIDDIPAADVRSVITCGECKHWFENGTDYCSCDRDALLRERDFFCAAGEKREES